MGTKFLCEWYLSIYWEEYKNIELIVHVTKQVVYLLCIQTYWACLS